MLARLFVLVLAVVPLAGCQGHLQAGGFQVGSSIGPAESWEAGSAPEFWAPIFTAAAEVMAKAEPDQVAAILDGLVDADGCPLGAGKVWLERELRETTSGTTSGQGGGTDADATATTDREEIAPLAALCGPASLGRSNPGSGGMWSAIGSAIWGGVGIALAYFGVGG